MTQQINAAIAAFAEQFNRFQIGHGALVAELAALAEIAPDDVGDVLDDSAANLKSWLGSKVSNNTSDDSNEQEEAICEAESWVTDNVSNGTMAGRVAAVLWLDGLEKGAQKIRESANPADKVSLRLTLDVTYLLNGEASSEMIARLQRMCELAIGEGMLTGYGDAEVDTHSVRVEVLNDPLSEDELTGFMLQRIENGDLALEDIPVRLAQYGLMEPNAFVGEMRERMDPLKEGLAD